MGHDRDHRAWWARGREFLALAFVGVSLWLVGSVVLMRAGIEQRVGLITLVSAVEAELGVVESPALEEQRRQLAGAWAELETSEAAAPFDSLQAALDQLRERPGDPADVAAAFDACRGFVDALRAELSTISERLGALWTVLCVQMALACLVALYAIHMLRTERKLVRELEQSQARLVEAHALAEDASAAKTQLLARASHDLRTPLNAILGFSVILLRNERSQFDEKDLDLLTRVRKSGHQLLRLVNSMLDLSVIESGRLQLERQPVHLDEVVRDCVSLFEPRAAELGLQLVIDSPPAQQPLQTDGGKLGQMLLNLVGNAVKYTRRGVIKVTVTVASDGRPLRIDVADTGVGIPEERLAEMFEAFRQMETSSSIQHDGAGLGLAITRSLADLLDLELEARSRPGEGSTFSIVLDPAGASDRQAADTPSPLAEER